MSSKQVNFTTEIVAETHKIEWKITNFKKMADSTASRDTLFIEVETGSSANLEAKWIIGFSSQQIYCKPVKLPGNIQKVGATLSINSDLNPYLRNTQVSQCLTLNEQMVASCGNLQACFDGEGSLVLDMKLTVMMPQSVKSKPTPCLPD